MRGPLAVLRSLAPSGRHRAAPAPLINLPMDAELCEARYCPEEMRSTYHAIHADGSRTCWTCCTTTGADT